ncbi:hypothetical protein H4R33_004943 [Dimargaris cristalligena]|nr:hypothetical protein H4R33_004943 [Dimargaris cristalligena]
MAIVGTATILPAGLAVQPVPVAHSPPGNLTKREPADAAYLPRVVRSAEPPVPIERREPCLLERRRPLRRRLVSKATVDQQAKRDLIKRHRHHPRHDTTSGSSTSTSSSGSNTDNGETTEEEDLNETEKVTSGGSGSINGEMQTQESTNSNEVTSGGFGNTTTVDTSLQLQSVDTKMILSNGMVLINSSGFFAKGTKEFTTEDGAD